MLVTHQLQDAFYVATHSAVSENGHFAIVPANEAARREVTFVMLKDGAIYFEGTAGKMRNSDDPYLETFLSEWVPPLVA